MSYPRYLTFLSLILLSLQGLFAGCALFKGTSTPDMSITGSTTQVAASIEYQNPEYGFSFSLPASWEGYSILIEKWEGFTIGLKGDELVEQGPMISIRHPQWTIKNPRQDIPIMVFTLDQWNSLQRGNFNLGAAPIGPSELGRNTQYVFLLPARYNVAMLKGYEEVETILEENPLHIP